MEEEKNYCNEKTKVEWEMGIDEAGRGPVFGPMVYGACIWPIELKETLKKIGFADSKKLTPVQREMLFEKIKAINNIKMHYKLDNLSPIFLSNQQQAIGETNLNDISHNSAIKLINEAINEGYNIKKVVYLDTVGPKATYQSKLEKKFKDIKPDMNFEVSEKADSKFPVVSAASICAKVTRDELLNQWQFREAKQFSREFGSGYPSDPKTVKWLQENFEPVFGYPQLIRFSWKTTETAMEGKGLKIEYIGEEKPAKTQKVLKKKKNQGILKDKILKC